MKLYGSLTSPYVRKVRIVLQEKDIPCEFVVSDPWDAQSNIPSRNPLGKVPVLELDNGSTLFDSPVIVEYLDQLKGELLIPATGDSRWQVLRWQALADGILDAVVTRLLETRRPVEQQSDETIARQESKVACAMEFAENAHTDETYLLSPRLTMADVAVGVALAYTDFRYPHDWRAHHQRLTHWFEGIDKRTSFAETQPPGMEATAGSSREKR
ncbi:MAG: glutathione S-transferase N-terminal domain-containing protein [Acidiferrobacterales bacterium]